MNTREHAEMLHAEHHNGSVVPTLESCSTHTVEDYLTLAHELEGEHAEKRLISQWVLVDARQSRDNPCMALMAAAAEATVRLQHLAHTEGVALEPIHSVRMVVEAFVKDPS